MKQITLLQGKTLLIELPEKHEAAFKALRNGRELTINRKNKSANVDHITFDFGFAEQLFNHGLLDCTSGSLDTGDRHYLFSLGWRIIGMLSEVTEEQIENIMGGVDLGDRKLFNIMEAYPNRMTNSAIEALESWILAEGWKFHNPHKKPGYIPKTMTAEFAYREEMDDWKKAQSRVLDRSRCLLLGRDDL